LRLQKCDVSERLKAGFAQVMHQFTLLHLQVMYQVVAAPAVAKNQPKEDL